MLAMLVTYSNVGLYASAFVNIYLYLMVGVQKGLKSKQQI